ncbi:MAG TPA: ABC transporter ATP-binding protein [Acidimicrobiia bacterium]|nr:ABC transporter ATP-binding protein [Acidimicrobiia bacterium]
MSEANGSASETTETEATIDTGAAGATAGGTLLSTTGLDVRYGSVQALFDVSIDVPAGSVVAVLGANGAGKSTLARAVSGLVPSFGGRVTFDGRDITKAAPYDIRRAGLVHIPEGRGIFPGLSVQENLRMAVRRVGTPDQRRSAVDHAYELVPRLAERRSQRAGTLSGGEQQMLALARALAVPPKVIIADEMSLGLAPLVVDFVFENIQRASETGVTIVLIEQFIHRALGLADQCVILKQGSVAWTGPSDHARQEVLDRYLGESADAMS